MNTLFKNTRLPLLAALLCLHFSPRRSWGRKACPWMLKILPNTNSEKEFPHGQPEPRRLQGYAKRPRKTGSRNKPKTAPCARQKQPRKPGQGPVQ